MSLQPAMLLIGLLAPLIEILIGIGLLFPRTRLLALWGATAMCLFVLLTIGPLGHQWNSSVWPWNIALLAMAALLFYRTPSLSARSILWVPRSLAHKLVVVFFGFMPLLSFLGYWNGYLSWSLYSGRVPTATLEIPAEQYATLPPRVQDHAQPIGEHNYQLEIAHWAMAEVNSPPYPSVRHFKHMGKMLCTDNTDSSVALLIYEYEPAHPHTPYASTRYTCSDLN